jgi:transcription elongation GreA/GreB family factor
MSRAFVNEDALTGDVIDRPVSPHPNYVTADGLAQIERALETAREAHAAAQIGGDRTELAKTASDLRYWSARRGSARMLTPDPNRETVQFGSIVTIVRDGREQTFQIVGEDEAEPSRGKISYVSPLARAIMNKDAGDTAMLGDSEIELIAASSGSAEDAPSSRGRGGNGPCSNH